MLVASNNILDVFIFLFYILVSKKYIFHRQYEDLNDDVKFLNEFVT